jgi:hypothetical protein
MRLGFTPLPLLFFLFLMVTVVSYVAFVELVKRRSMRAHRHRKTPSTARPNAAPHNWK